MFILIQNFYNIVRANKEVITNQFYNTLRFVLSVLISMASIKLITSYLDPEQFGIYRYVLSVAGICRITIMTGVGKILSGYVRREYHGSVQESTLLSFKTGSLGVLVLVMFGFYSLIETQNRVESILFFVSAAVFLPYYIFPRFEFILGGLEKFKEILLFRIGSKIILISAALIVLVLFDQGILIYGISQLVLASFLFALLFIYSKRQLSNDKVDLGFKRHSFMISLIALGSVITVPGIQVYLKSSIGITELAYFVVATSISTRITAVVKPIIQPVTLKIMKNTKNRYRSYVIKLTLPMLFFGLFLYLILYMSIDTFGQYIVSKEYEISLLYAKLLGIVIILAPLYSLYNSYVVFEKLNKAFSVSLYSNQLATIIGYVLFVDKFGVKAIAFSNLAAVFVSIVVMAYSILRDKE
ncbi:hypothetical protein E3V55_04315 [Candidatus Marinimicrobia bacterium MT.SAG.3]|nr:hypothetical protein E3V55_04315 [Candidatus Marinimicrobia bacterium MT.SAG.3]